MLQQIKEILAKQLRKDPAEIADDADIIEDLGADSLDIVELLMNLEEAFGINVPDEDVPELKTVKDVADYIQKKTR